MSDQFKAFDEWLGQLAVLAGYVSAAALVIDTGAECWAEFYDEGLTPAEAWAEDCANA